MERTATLRPTKRPLSERAQERLIRQKMHELEQEAEDMDALSAAALDLQVLHQSFSSVKAEFSDLDGLSWDTPDARQLLVNWHAQQVLRHRPTHPGPGGFRARRIQARADLASVVSAAISSSLAHPSPQPPITIPILPSHSTAYMDKTIRANPATPPSSRPALPIDPDRTPLPSLSRHRTVRPADDSHTPSRRPSRRLPSSPHSDTMTSSASEPVFSFVTLTGTSHTPSAIEPAVLANSPKLNHESAFPAYRPPMSRAKAPVSASVRPSAISKGQGKSKPVGPRARAMTLVPGSADHAAASVPSPQRAAPLERLPQRRPHERRLSPCAPACLATARLVYDSDDEDEGGYHPNPIAFERTVSRMGVRLPLGSEEHARAVAAARTARLGSNA